MTVNSRWGSGRIRSVTVHGTQASVTLSGPQFRGALGLKSSLVWINENLLVTGEIRALYDSLDCSPGPAHRPGLGAVRRPPAELRERDHLHRRRAGQHSVFFKNGEILDKYWALGGLSSFLGWPVTGRRRRAVGARATFMGGAIYDSPDTDPHETHGIVQDAYLNAGGPAGSLGLPDTDVQSSGDDRSQQYQHGSITCNVGSGDCTRPGLAGDGRALLADREAVGIRDRSRAARASVPYVTTISSWEKSSRRRGSPVASCPSTNTRSRLSPDVHRLPMQSRVNSTPQTSKNSPSEKARSVGDSTWMTPLASWVCSGAMNCPGRVDPDRGRDRHPLAVDEHVEVLVRVQHGSLGAERREAEGAQPLAEAVVPRRPRRRSGLDARAASTGRSTVSGGRYVGPGRRRARPVELVEGGERQQQHEGAGEDRPARAGGRRGSRAAALGARARGRFPASSPGRLGFVPVRRGCAGRRVPLAGGAALRAALARAVGSRAHGLRSFRPDGRALDLSLCIFTLSVPMLRPPSPYRPLRDGGPGLAERRTRDGTRQNEAPPHDRARPGERHGGSTATSTSASEAPRVRTEIIAGLATFLTMAYILFVNPAILGSVKDHTGHVAPVRRRS